MPHGGERDPARACRDVDLVVVATPVGTIAPLVATLARTFGVNKGTIQRDLYTLMDAGLPVRSERTGDRRNTTRWWIEGDMPW